MSVYFTGAFTNAGTPVEGLSVTIRVYKLSDNSVVVNDAAVSEVGGGAYKYDFTALYDATADYIARMNAGVDTVDSRYLFGGPVITGAQVNAEVDTALSDYDPPTKTELDSGLALLATPAQVNAEVLDVMNVDTHAEPAQGAPGATVSIFAKINYLYKRFRNKYTETATQGNVYNDAGDTIDHKVTLSDDGTTFTKGEYGGGP
jgi:hypothetical protein